VKSHYPVWQISRNGWRQKFWSRINNIYDGQFNYQSSGAWPAGVVPWQQGGAVIAKRLENILEPIVVVPPAMTLQNLELIEDMKKYFFF
jgi:hypothetical protein